MTCRESLQVTAKHLKMALDVWNPERRRLISELRARKEELIKLARDTRISKVAGSATAVVGGVITVVGFGLIPVTLGGSLIISGVGTVIGTAGAITSTGSMIADKMITSSKLKHINPLLDIDNQLTQAVSHLYQELEGVANRICEDGGLTKEEIATGVLRGGEALLRVSAITIKGGLTGMEVAAAGGIGALEGGIFAARIGSAALNGIAIAGGVANLVLIPINIAELIYNSVNLHKNKTTSAIDKLDEQLVVLHDQQQALRQYWMGREGNPVDT